MSDAIVGKFVRRVSRHLARSGVPAWMAMLLACGALGGSARGLTQPTGADAEVVDWLMSRAQPISRVAPDREPSDLQFLERVVGGAQVVGLGEATHGTREFFQLKDRLVRYLVTELGFTTLAMEAGASDIELLNDYVLHGNGDLDSALTAQGYIGWDTEEIAAMFEWMRTYNNGVSVERRVHVVGLDILMHARGRTRVLEYVQTHAPARLAETKTLLQTLAEEEANLGSTRLRPERVAASQHQLEILRDFLLAQAGTGADVGHGARVAARDVARMIQRAQSAIPPEAPGHLNRSVAMGRNLVELIEERAGSKVIVWAHNVHVTDRNREGTANLGSELRARFGEAYYAIGFEFGRGGVQVRPRTAQGALGPLRELDVAPAPPMSLPGYLSQASSRTMFVDLRASRPPLVTAWLAQPHEAHFIAWNHEASQPRTVRETIGRYDGLVYVPVSTPARPTRNAAEKAASGEPL